MTGTLTLEGALELVREHGGRITSSRRLLLEVLFASPAHRSAEEIAVKVQSKDPDVHLSTVYRNLDELEKLGIVQHTHVGHGPATYHLATIAHGHFVCGNCGAMFEAPPSLFESLAAEARQRYGFSVDAHHFAVLGRCADCA